eukprot:NODE_24674_length_615_cov_1.491803.p1 GENE.NODE_24674_length_615_cov_1.491803~~NODE_24674_length_615_cov_1.491803.p1  ORF type:complete len:121 (+),score=43.43 NODE_24674_length_615_cov_1.491803:206-568(+)
MLIQMIIDDAQKLLKQSQDSENTSQSGYENFVKTSNGVIEQLKVQITSKNQLLAASKMALAESTNGFNSAVTQLGLLGNYKTQVHKSCDYLIKNFDIRQATRLKEVEAVRQAKAIMSGAK